MFVDFVRAGQQFAECLAPDGDRQRHADRRPQRIAAAHPVPHHETVVRVDAEGVHRLRIGRDRGEVRGHGRLAQLRGQPLPRGARVGERLLRAEGLRGDDEQRARRVGVLERVGEIGAVDVGDEQHARRIRGQRMQRLHRHGGPEVRAADADVDDRGESRTARAAHHAFAHALGECQHALALGEHLARDVLAARTVGRYARHAQRRVQYRAPFGGVDGFAAPHRLDARAQSGGIGQARQQAQAVVIDALARKIQVEPGGFAREAAAARRIRVAQRAQAHGAGFGGARLQGTPGGGQIVVGHRDWDLAAKEGGDGIDNVLELRLRQLRVDRQRQRFLRGAQTLGKVLAACGRGTRNTAACAAPAGSRSRRPPRASPSQARSSSRRSTRMQYWL